MYQVTSFRKGFVNLCIALMKEALGGDLMTKWKVFWFCSDAPLSPSAPGTAPLETGGSESGSLLSLTLMLAVTFKKNLTKYKTRKQARRRFS